MLKGTNNSLCLKQSENDQGQFLSNNKIKLIKMLKFNFRGKTDFLPDIWDKRVAKCQTESEFTNFN